MAEKGTLNGIILWIRTLYRNFRVAENWPLRPFDHFVTNKKEYSTSEGLHLLHFPPGPRHRFLQNSVSHTNELVTPVAASLEPLCISRYNRL